MYPCFLKLKSLFNFLHLHINVFLGQGVLKKEVYLIMGVATWQHFYLIFQRNMNIYFLSRFTYLPKTPDKHSV